MKASELPKLCPFVGKATLGICILLFACVCSSAQFLGTQLRAHTFSFVFSRVCPAASRSNELHAMNDKRKEEVFDGTPSHYLAVIAQPVNVYLNYRRLLHADGTPLSAGEAKKLLAVRTHLHQFVCGSDVSRCVRFLGANRRMCGVGPGPWCRAQGLGSRVQLVQGPKCR